MVECARLLFGQAPSLAICTNAKMVLGLFNHWTPAILNPTFHSPQPNKRQRLSGRRNDRLYSMEGNKNPNHQNGERSTDHTQQNGEKSPTPPPHMSFSPTKSSGDAEAYKKAGNRYFVQREYTQAAEMYSLGIDCKS